MDHHKYSSKSSPADSASASERRNVLIVGSSIAGTVFALQLLTHPILRSRYQPILFDSARTLPGIIQSESLDFLHPDGQSGAAVALSKQAMRPLRALDLGLDLDEIAQNTERLCMYRQPLFGPKDGSQQGIPILEWEESAYVGITGGIWTVQRGALQGLLIKTILARGGEIVLNKKLSRVIEHDDEQSEAVEAIFSDSSSYRGDLLVGADGAWSTVRQHIYTTTMPSGKDIINAEWKPKFQNLNIMHGISRAQTTDTKPTIYAMGLPGVGTGTWTLKDKRQMWTIYESPCAPPPDNPQSRARAEADSKVLSEKLNMDVFTGGYDQASTEAFLERYRNVWHLSAGTFGHLFDASEKIVRVGLWQKLFTRLGNVHWRSGEKRPKECLKDFGCERGHGNIVLIGDAARVLMPTAGQGAGFAIEDATVLADCLLNHPAQNTNTVLDFSNAIREHTRQRLPRYKKISTIADWGARIAVGRTWLDWFIRDYAAGWSPQPKAKLEDKAKRWWWEKIGSDDWLVEANFEVKLRNKAGGPT